MERPSCAWSRRHASIPCGWWRRSPRGKTGYNVSGYFNNYNAGKLGILLNCNTEEGQRIARRLVEWADIFLTNITPRVIERWGLTYDNLAQINPQIIAAYQPMQGFDGPHRDFLGFGAVLTPITGYNHLSGFPHRPPMGLGTNYPDYVINPGHTFVAIMAALRYRRRTGKGQRIEWRSSNRPPHRSEQRSSTTQRTAAWRTAPGTACRTPRLTTPSSAGP